MAAKSPHNLFWSILLIGLGLLLVSGCGTPRQRYEVLSFFFDGVPNPDAVKKSANNAETVVRATRIVSQHKPYAENACAACHRTATGDIQEFNEAYKRCLKCHEKVPQGRRLMHGPVVREACRWCHAPHESAEPALLKDAPIKVCTQCHDRNLLGNNPPEHLDGTTSCLQCHYGHGGNARYFLKPPGEWPAASMQPASAPSPSATVPALDLAPGALPGTGVPASARGKEPGP
jgi:predicted CXXCH cytochrome family protein